MEIDLNADLGESWYGHRIGNDAALMPYLDSCNIACGFHGGDALTMRRTIELALHHRVHIGAHPSFPDRENFGRRTLRLPPERLEALLLYQVAALSGMVRAAGGKLHHLKPHGALYHFAAFGPDASAAAACARVARAFGGLILYGPQDSHLEREAEFLGLPFWPEGFVDRGYEEHNRLVPRGQEGAVLHDPGACAAQASDLARGSIRLQTGKSVAVRVRTICIHGDHRDSPDRARAVRRALGAAPNKQD